MLPDYIITHEQITQNGKFYISKESRLRSIKDLFIICRLVGLKWPSQHTINIMSSQSVS